MKNTKNLKRLKKMDENDRMFLMQSDSKIKLETKGFITLKKRNIMCDFSQPWSYM